jgi:hypothetical protein
VQNPAKFLILWEKKFFEIFLNFCDYTFGAGQKSRKLPPYHLPSEAEDLWGGPSGCAGALLT